MMNLDDLEHLSQHYNEMQNIFYEVTVTSWHIIGSYPHNNTSVE